MPPQPVENVGKVCENSRAGENRVFTDLHSNSPKRSPRFSPDYEGTESTFYFLNDVEELSLILIRIQILTTDCKTRIRTAVGEDGLPMGD